MDIEDRLSIPTPEGVNVDLVVAGLGSRFIGYLVDLAIQSLLILALTLGLGAFGELGVASATIGIFVVSVLYPVLFETFDHGRSPGKRVAGLRVVTREGGEVTFVTSATRNVLRFIDALPGPFTVGIVAILFTPLHQRVGDLAAGTLVVRNEAPRAAIPLSAWVSPSPELPPDAATWDVSAVTAEEVATARSFLLRRGELTPEARQQVGWELASRLQHKVVGLPTSEGPERFLELLVAVKLSR